MDPLFPGIMVRRIVDDSGTIVGRTPTRGSDEAAGFDLYAREGRVMMPYRVSPQTHKVPLGVEICIPRGYFGLICGRSGRAAAGTLMHTGIIDSDYRGELSAILVNFSDQTVSIAPGDRVAQLVIQRHRADALLLEVPELPSSDRGRGGLGSTGR